MLLFIQQNLAPSGGGGVNYSLSGAAGSYVITGQPGTLAVARKLSGAVGSYSITGQSGTFTLARKLSGSAGSYSIGGQSGTLTYARSLSGTAGAYSITGQAGTLTYTPGSSSTPYALSGAAGAYVITGQSATLAYQSNGPVAYSLSGDAGSYSITGLSADLTYTSASVVYGRDGLGGDDAIRYEIWEKPPVPRRRDDTLDKIIREAYDKIRGIKKPEPVVAVAPVVVAKPIYDESDDEEAILLLM